MNTQYTVITDNGGGPNQIYHDIAGEIYTFPTMYRNKLTPGTKVIYHRVKKKSDDESIPDRLSEESHYFGIAEIDTVSPTNDGNLRATIKNYKRFKYPVMIHRPNGDYYEIKPFFQQGARATTKEVYDDICKASTIEPIPVMKKTASKRGVRSLTQLMEGIRSNPFSHGKYQVVTGRNGYYLKNLADGVYYELIVGLTKEFDYKDGSLKVLAKKVDNAQQTINYLIRHESSDGTKDVGILDPIQNGLRFCGMFEGQDVKVNIML